MPTPFPASRVSKLFLLISIPVCRRSNLPTGEVGVRGWTLSQVIRPQESLALYKSFNSLWGGRMHMLAVFRIWYSINTDPNTILTRTTVQGFDSQKLEKIYCWKKSLFLIKNYCTINLSLGLHKGFSSYRRSLQPSKENIPHFKTWIF